MKVLLTGAFGFELKNKRNIKRLKKYKNEVEIIWGNLRNKNEFAYV